MVGTSPIHINLNNRSPCCTSEEGPYNKHSSLVQQGERLSFFMLICMKAFPTTNMRRVCGFSHTISIPSFPILMKRWIAAKTNLYSLSV